MKTWKKKAVVVLVLCLILCSRERVSADESGRMIAEVRKGVVQIAAVHGRSGKYITYSSGTGFGIGKTGEDTEVFLTNWHVVVDDQGNICDEIYIMLDNADIQDEDTLVRCEVLYTTTGYPDFAVIRACEKVKGIKALSVLSSEKTLQGSAVYALGYPAATEYGVTHSTIDDVTVTTGVVSKFIEVEQLGTKCIVHDAHINNGSSGGPLVTIDGAVIGINTYTLGEDDTYSYAVYIDYAMEALDELEIDYDVYTEEDSGTEAGTGADQKEPGTGTGADQKESGTEADQEKSEEKHENGKSPRKAMTIAYRVSGTVIVLAALGGVWFAFRRKKQHPSPEPTDYSVMDRNGRRIPVPGEGIMIGRDISCTITLPADAKGVSRQHCRLTVEKGVLTLTDVGSTYGTFIGRKRLSANKPVALNRGTSFYLGEQINSFTVL